MSGLWFLAVCSPAIRYSPDEESGAAASVGFRFLAVCSPAIRYSPDEESGAAASVGFRNNGSAPYNLTNRILTLAI
ncbi:hypothetical protein [Pedobacter sp. Leaf216]|uniref:hypothetical protein n=1 Tax=Pedobacter sp. Leaf216 TaxID=1735684 RepID=UPI0006FF6CD3|nr:hypothetical protein [Pedobacter sp. Leaf216]